jgi:aspartate aminotransferase
MSIAEKIGKALESASPIRKLFSEGEALKTELGAENVCDFTLGNPDVPPPEEFTSVLREILSEDLPNKHGYMNTSGLPETREVIAAAVAARYGTAIRSDLVTMTVGAGGALSLTLAAILNPGDRIVINAPVFVAYGNYVSFHQGILDVVPGLPDFSLNLKALEEHLTRDTAAVIINSPNNPSGVIYSETSLRELADILDRKSREFGRRIYIISDEPYREIVYDNEPVPSPLSLYPHTILCYSWSKSLSIPGERIGYAAVHPEAEDAELLVKGMALMTQNMGITNAPSLMQRAVARLTHIEIQKDLYRFRRDLLVDGLRRAGYSFQIPRGAFYLFPKAPGGDDERFCRFLKESERILTVPGTGFYQPGYLRISYCVPQEVIRKAIPGFARAIQSYSAFADNLTNVPAGL